MSAPSRSSGPRLTAFGSEVPVPLSESPSLRSPKANLTPAYLEKCAGLLKGLLKKWDAPTLQDRFLKIQAKEKSFTEGIKRAGEEIEQQKRELEAAETKKRTLTKTHQEFVTKVQKQIKDLGTKEPTKKEKLTEKINVNQMKYEKQIKKIDRQISDLSKFISMHEGNLDSLEREKITFYNEYTDARTFATDHEEELEKIFSVLGVLKFIEKQVISPSFKDNIESCIHSLRIEREALERKKDQLEKEYAAWEKQIRDEVFRGKLELLGLPEEDFNVAMAAKKDVIRLRDETKQAKDDLKIERQELDGKMNEHARHLSVAKAARNKKWFETFKTQADEIYERSETLAQSEADCKAMEKDLLKKKNIYLKKIEELLAPVIQKRKSEVENQIQTIEKKFNNYKEAVVTLSDLDAQSPRALQKKKIKVQKIATPPSSLDPAPVPGSSSSSSSTSNFVSATPPPEPQTRRGLKRFNSSLLANPDTSYPADTDTSQQHSSQGKSKKTKVAPADPTS